MIDIVNINTLNELESSPGERRIRSDLIRLPSGSYLFRYLPLLLCVSVMLFDLAHQPASFRTPSVSHPSIDFSSRCLQRGFSVRMIRHWLDPSVWPYLFFSTFIQLGLGLGLAIPLLFDVHHLPWTPCTQKAISESAFRQAQSGAPSPAD